MPLITDFLRFGGVVIPIGRMIGRVFYLEVVLARSVAYEWGRVTYEI
jgi:hypothetical protein